MDLNRPIATYKCRFQDPWNSDVYVSQHTGQVLQRRPLFWRIFEPFLTVHTFAFTGRKTHSPSDQRALVIGGCFAVIMLSFLGWQLRTNRLHDRIVDPKAPPATAHGH